MSGGRFLQGEWPVGTRIVHIIHTRGNEKEEIVEEKRESCPISVVSARASRTFSYHRKLRMFQIFWPKTTRNGLHAIAFSERARTHTQTHIHTYTRHWLSGVVARRSSTISRSPVQMELLHGSRNCGAITPKPDRMPLFHCIYTLHISRRAGHHRTTAPPHGQKTAKSARSDRDERETERKREREKWKMKEEETEVKNRRNSRGCAHGRMLILFYVVIGRKRSFAFCRLQGSTWIFAR